MDKRVERSRTLLLNAFRALVLCKPFEDITVHEIVRRAGVARSTFYDHFSDKHALLLCSTQPMLDTLAACGQGRGSRVQVEAVISHMWENRALGRMLLRSSAQRSVCDALAAQILAGSPCRPCTPPHCPTDVSVRFAAGSLASCRRRKPKWLPGCSNSGDRAGDHRGIQRY